MSRKTLVAGFRTNTTEKAHAKTRRREDAKENIAAGGSDSDPIAAADSTGGSRPLRVLTPTAKCRHRFAIRVHCHRIAI